MDAQGYDMKVLKGAGENLCRAKKLLVEATVTKKQFYKGASSRAELIDYLKARNFELEREESQTMGEEANMYFVNMRVCNGKQL